MADPVVWSPTVDAVGALLRARTKTTDGVEAGTFTVNTRPTAVQVAELIAIATSDVLGAVEEHTVVISDGTTIIEEYAYSAASGSAVVKAAMLVELSYFPEQVATGRSPYDQLSELYSQRLSHLRRLLGVAGDGNGGLGGRTQSPVYTFPDRTMIGLDTQW
ncbi:MAG: hypothetical protein LC679_08725 [Intrasporangiaceae bacterium]|nr:hypothetical protein [Intrasporangiaceae bacterium]